MPCGDMCKESVHQPTGTVISRRVGRGEAGRRGVFLWVHWFLTLLCWLMVYNGLQACTFVDLLKVDTGVPRDCLLAVMDDRVGWRKRAMGS